MNSEEARAFVAENRHRLKSRWFSELNYCVDYIAHFWNWSRSIRAAVYAYFVIGPTLTMIIDVAKYVFWRCSEYLLGERPWMMIYSPALQRSSLRRKIL